MTDPLGLRPGQRLPPGLACDGQHYAYEPHLWDTDHPPIE